jgi:hypothetical protein
LAISAAWSSASMSSEKPSLDDLWGAISQNMDVLRLTAMGDQPEVRVLLVFAGAVTLDEAVVSTAWGPLRPLTEPERQAAPEPLEGLIGTTDAAGKQISVSYAGDLVLETTVPLGMVVHSTADPVRPEVDWRTTTRGIDELRERWEGIQLATLFAVQRPANSLATLRPSWWWAEDPLSSIPAMGWFNTKDSPGFTPFELGESECNELGEWTTRIKTRRTPKVDISVRRVISATHARVDPADRLIDAVIAWESLFGTREGEPTLRVSSAMAWLLGTDFDSRRAMQRDISGLYNLRSDIVHGTTAGGTDLAVRSNRALELAIQALAALFRDHPDVLAMPDGSERSRYLLLGGASPTQ